MKQKTIKQIGIVVKGEAVIVLWGGGKGTVKMDRTFIPNGKITHTNIMRCVNDGGFGCESIESASIEIQIKYDNGSTEFERDIELDHPIQRKHFLGWAELAKIGIK